MPRSREKILGPQACQPLTMTSLSLRLRNL